jgi:hypothetical protein
LLECAIGMNSIGVVLYSAGRFAQFRHGGRSGAGGSDGVCQLGDVCSPIVCPPA